MSEFIQFGDGYSKTTVRWHKPIPVDESLRQHFGELWGERTLHWSSPYITSWEDIQIIDMTIIKNFASDLGKQGNKDYIIEPGLTVGEIAHSASCVIGGFELIEYNRIDGDENTFDRMIQNTREMVPSHHALAWVTTAIALDDEWDAPYESTVERCMSAGMQISDVVSLLTAGITTITDALFVFENEIEEAILLPYIAVGITGAAAILRAHEEGIDAMLLSRMLESNSG